MPRGFPPINHSAFSSLSNDVLQRLALFPATALKQFAFFVSSQIEQKKFDWHKNSSAVYSPFRESP